MIKVLLSLLLTIWLVTLVIYEFLGICRILGKEEIVEKLWKKLFPNKKYNETIILIIVRPLFLFISAFCYNVAGSWVELGMICELLMDIIPIIALGNMLKNLK